MNTNSNNNLATAKFRQDFWKNRQVLVTGAAGFVGAHLVDELLRLQAKVVVLIRDHNPQSQLFKSGNVEQVTLVSGDLEDYWSIERALNEHEVDTVFHLGARAIVGAANRAPLPIFESNIRGTYNLLEACRTHEKLVKRIVVASSDKAYGSQPVLPYTEDMPLIGRFPYDVSKTCTDLLAQSYFHSFNLPIAISRCGNIFGGGDLNWSRIIPGTIRSLLAGESPIIRSDGTYVRDYIYVKDVVHAYLSLGEAVDRPEIKGQAFNFGPARPMSVLELVDIIAKTMKLNHIKPSIQNTAKGEIRDQYLSSKKAETLLGWNSEYTMERGLAETIDWYRAYLEPELYNNAAGVINMAPINIPV